jgi:hypothetical protein
MKFVMKKQFAVLAAYLVLVACNSELDRSSDWTATMARADPPSANERVVILPESGDDDQFGIDCARRRSGSHPNF